MFKALVKLYLIIEVLKKGSITVTTKGVFHRYRRQKRLHIKTKNVRVNSDVEKFRNLAAEQDADEDVRKNVLAFQFFWHYSVLD